MKVAGKAGVSNLTRSLAQCCNFTFERSFLFACLSQAFLGIF
jgi:hypothetical protein